MNATSGNAWGRRAGRLLLAGQFVYGGYLAARDPGARPAALDRAGMPGGADLAAILLAAFQQYGLQPGPLLFVTNAPLVWGLIASLLPTTVVGHPFWREQEPAARSAQTLQFVKNLSMLGGLVIEASSPEPRRR